MTQSTDIQSYDQFSLLGTTLVSIQKVTFSLYQAMQPVCKMHSSPEVQQLVSRTSDQFLQGTTAELKPTLLLVEEARLPLTINELLDFIYKRNLVSQQFWHVTDADIKGSEKIANPEDFLRKLLTECETLQGKIEANGTC
ncbi:glucosamine-6-phosphate deaminase [Vibrio alginolyticus]|uniref:glucosamine-6-phosphate deaminase n=1 Tax=Vibrio alginolyticus TaxID=663 RepID=UPI00215E21F2|nr:glucosamine-6-phosphate deaminase [Vibrio alginolyticus]ELA6791226.1 glucosamine-6-phosphate deaminase [Vibrio alginolyticus]ELA7353581.1 glucosamine-6-phosphate deaminase [Vibrio alginolyticus]ELA8174736.1 glucosamine-6-phosphate deaminase [Vibrio alginolyticus]ELA8375056.1 glucosamine-6-phosphate deaminase [Vibrio alginolyticus]ELA9458967.1 glucosamine-6-phosphate deaminase [Vibrio alginolyticus]